MSAGAWLGWASAAIIPLEAGEQGFNVTKGQMSTIVALMDLGNILTPIPTSFLMDFIGRKYTLYTTGILYFMASFLCFLATNEWYLYFARIFAGMGKGVAFAVVPIYLAEVANVQIRGALSTMFIGFLNLGMLYDYMFGWILPYEGLNIVNAIIPIAFAILFLFVPESPYYLTMKNKPEKAITSLATYRQVNRDNEGLQREYNLVRSTVEKDLKNKSNFWDVAGTKSNRRALFIIALLAMFQRMSGISPTLAFMTVTLPETGGGASIKAYMVIFSFILVVSNYVATPLIDTWGRKNLLIYSAVSSAVIQFIAGLFYFLREAGIDLTSWNWVPYVCLVVFAFTYSLGIGFIPSTLVGELFPQNVKSYASSISAILLAVVSFFVNRLFREFSVHVMYFFFGLSCTACAIFCVYFVFETKGKTFAEIQRELQDLSRDEEYVLAG